MKTMNEFLKEAAEQLEEDSPTMGVTSAGGAPEPGSSHGPGIKGDWVGKKRLKGIMLTLRRKIKQGR